jgi:hypothetical protein
MQLSATRAWNPGRHEIWYCDTAMAVGRGEAGDGCLCGACCDLFLNYSRLEGCDRTSADSFPENWHNTAGNWKTKETEKKNIRRKVITLNVKNVLCNIFLKCPIWNFGIFSIIPKIWKNLSSYYFIIYFNCKWNFPVAMILQEGTTHITWHSAQCSNNPHHITECKGFCW